MARDLQCLNISHSSRNAPSAAVVKFYLSLFPALFLPTLSHINHVYMHRLCMETKLARLHKKLLDGSLGLRHEATAEIQKTAAPQMAC